jgi:broad specificity phosphatase PhoE
MKTEDNLVGIISGQRDVDVMYCDGTKIDFKVDMVDQIYCSDLIRCRNTLKLLMDKQNINDVNIHYDTRLNERGMGDYEGKKKSELIKIYPQEFKNGLFDVFKTPPNGEGYYKFHKRVYQFFEEYLNNYGSQKVLVCSHNQVLKMLRLLILGKEVSYKNWSEKTFKNGVVERISK